MSNKPGSDPYLGEFEQLVLLALLQLGGEAYGVRVRQDLERRAGRRVSLGTVYTTLNRLEAKGLIRSRIGDPTPERGGRRKKHYVVVSAGRRALRVSLTALRRMTRGLDAALEAP
ncbi:MAG: PadR family transcriptional regulator [Gemmatimonadales bacterium]